MISASLRAQVEAWIVDDPDPRDRAELRALLDAAEPAARINDRGAETTTAESAEMELADRFAARLQFGTAGIRGVMAAGPNRMNRAVVRATTAALAGWLAPRDLGARKSGVVIGFDARHRSADFSEEAACVLAAAGFRVHMLPPRQPTPLLAFAVRHLSASAGLMITASHNPPRDNGYKLYLGDGAQIIPPVDAEIEATIGAIGPLSQIPVTTPGDPLIVRYGDEVAQAYLDAILAAAHPRDNDAAKPPTAPTGLNQRELRIVYTPLHGVAAPLALRAFERAGFPAPHIVAAQAEPDPDFPTVAFPNPEEPGALDLALAEARKLGADLVIANDPDGDRLAVAIPDPATDTGWRVLTGDQVGALLGAYLLERAPGHDHAPNPGQPANHDRVVDQEHAANQHQPANHDRAADQEHAARRDHAADRNRAAGHAMTGSQAGTGGLAPARSDPGAEQPVVATTVVSSTLLAKIAAAANTHYVETLTGLKWIVRASDNIPASRFVFGYEEALGYAVGDAVRDKDGISAALAILSLATAARANGETLLDRWDALERAHGVHLTAQVTLPTRSPDAVMTRLRADPASTLGGQLVIGTADLRAGTGGLPPADVLIYRLTNARVAIRPSGTEPKLKVYLEVVERIENGSLTLARATAAARLEPLRTAVAALIADPAQ